MVYSMVRVYFFISFTLRIVLFERDPFISTGEGEEDLKSRFYRIKL